jgi:murein DD-endopeptidase MepM/ murein hydrolase activator NlpD
MMSRRSIRSAKRIKRAHMLMGAGLLVATLGTVAVAGTLGEGNRVTPVASAETLAEAPVQASVRTAETLTAEVEHGHGGVSEDDVAASAAELAHSSYAAATKDELEDMRREARKKLVQDAIANGLPVDPKWLEDDASLSPGNMLAWPLAHYFISDYFGTRGGGHMGIDLAAGAMEPIGAAAPGVVIVSQDNYFGYGSAVVIQHADGYQSVYGHMTYGSRTVQVGDWVETGDHLGGVGNTGHSFGNHLHFEVRKNGVPVDPYPLLTGGSAAPVEIKPGIPVPPDPGPAEQPAPTEETTPGDEPSETPSTSPTPSESRKPSATPSPSKSPSPKPSPAPTEPPSPSPTTKPEPTKTPDPTKNPDPTKSPEPTKAPTPTAPPETTTPEPSQDPAPTQNPAPTQAPVPTTDPEPSSPPTQDAQPTQSAAPSAAPKQTATAEPQATTEPPADTATPEAPEETTAPPTEEP